MPLRHFVHVVGFDVPVPGQAAAGEPLIVLLDKVPVERWRDMFRQCAGELPAELQRGVPELHGDTIRFPGAAPMTRKHASDIRTFVDRINRLTFLGGKGALQPL